MRFTLFKGILSMIRLRNALIQTLLASPLASVLAQVSIRPERPAYSCFMQLYVEPGRLDSEGIFKGFQGFQAFAAFISIVFHCMLNHFRCQGVIACLTLREIL